MREYLASKLLPSAERLELQERIKVIPQTPEQKDAWTLAAQRLQFDDKYRSQIDLLVQASAQMQAVEPLIPVSPQVKLKLMMKNKWRRSKTPPMNLNPTRWMCSRISRSSCE